MDRDVETIYYLENPETDYITFATGSQLRYEDIIKDVFGVASIQDLPMMIQYNKAFQSCICKNHGITEDKITLEMILRVASRIDLLQLKQQIDGNDEQKNNDISPPFDAMIRLQEGIFKWDEEQSSYNLVKTI